MGRILPKVSYPNIQSTPKMVSYFEGDLVNASIYPRQITEELQTTVTIFLPCSNDLLRMQRQIHCYIRLYNRWVWFRYNCFKIDVLVFCLTFPPTSNNWLILTWKSQYLCCSLVSYPIFIDYKNHETFFCKILKIIDLYQLYKHRCV